MIPWFTLAGIVVMCATTIAMFVLQNRRSEPARPKAYRFVSPCRCGWKPPGVSVDCPPAETPRYIVIDVQCPECERIMRTVSRNVGLESVEPALRL